MKNLLLSLAFMLGVLGCPTGPIDVGAPDAAEHRVGGYSPITGAGFATFGSTPSLTGTVRGSNVFNVSARRADNSADVSLLDQDSSNILRVGDLANTPNARLLAATDSGMIVAGGASNALLSSGKFSIVGAALSLGSAPSSTGEIWGSSRLLISHAVGGVDRNIIEGTTGADVILGDPTTGGAVISRCPTAGSIYSQVGGLNKLVIGNVSTTNGNPIVGDTGSTSPYGVHGGVLVSVTSTPFTLSAAQYSADWIEVSTTTGANFTIVLPTATLATGYYKTIRNTSAFTATIQSGIGSKTLATLLAQRFFCGTAGAIAAASPTWTP